jgi:hypothetical protein
MADISDKDQADQCLHFMGLFGEGIDVIDLGTKEIMFF